MTTLYEGQRVISEHYDEQAHIMTRYVEKPVEEIHIKEVPKITYIDVIKQIPDVKIETVEKIVEEVCIEEVIKEVPVYREEEIIKKVPVKQVVEVPVEHIREVPVDKVITREEIIEVPGDIIETERVYDVQKPLIIPRYKDTTRPMVYRQLIKPIIRQVGPDCTGPGAPHEVEVNDYDPVLCKVLIHVPKPVKLPLINLGPVNTEHKWLNNVKDYDHLVRRCNTALNDSQLTGLLSGDSLIQPLPDTDFGGLPLIGPSPLPGTFNHGLVAPAKLPLGKPADPKPLINATYVNGIAREYSQLRGKRNPHVLPAINALKELRKYRYADPAYEKYLAQHHKYFSQNARLIDPVFEALKAEASDNLYPPNAATNTDAPTQQSKRSMSTSRLPPPTQIPHTARAAASPNGDGAGSRENKYRSSRGSAERFAAGPPATSRSASSAPHHHRTSPRHRTRTATRTAAGNLLHYRSS